MIDLLGYPLEADEFNIKEHFLTERHNLDDWKPNVSLLFQNRYFPVIKQEGYTLKIQTCPAKTLFNHNLCNILPSDLEPFLEATLKQLNAYGIETSKEILRSKQLNILHVNQLVAVPLTIDCCTRMLQTAEKYGKFQKGLSLYPDDGFCVFNNLKYRKLKFYDKTAEALKQPAAIEIANGLKKQHQTLLQVEFQMQGAREIAREYKLHGIKLENTLENAFNPIIARTILLARVKEAFKHIYVVNSPDYQLLENAEIICTNNNIHGLQAISSLLGCLWIYSQFGIHKLSHILSRWSDSKTASRYCKKIKQACSLLQEERDKKIFQEAILTTIQNMGEESTPPWQGNTPPDLLSNRPISPKELETC